MRQALFLRPDESGHSHGSQGTGIIEWRSFVRSGCAQAIEQGQVVFRCRHGVGCVFVVFVVDDSVEVALCDVIDDVLVEMFGRFRAAALVPFDAAQVVDDVAAGPDEIAFFTERGEFLAECEALVRRKQAVYGKLDDWDGRVRKHMDHNTPCSVVDAPGIVDGNGVAQKLADVLGQFRAALGRVLELIELFWKAVHVVDLTRLFGTLDIRAWDIPMGRDGQDGFGSVLTG